MRLRSASRRTTAALAVGFGLVATACGGGTEVVESAGQVTDGGEQVANTLFTDEFETIDGATFDLASLQGEDTVLWFWAPW